MRQDGRIVQDGRATAAGSFLQRLFQLFHEESIGVIGLVQEGESQLSGETTGEYLEGLFVGQLGRDRLTKGLVAGVDQIKAQLESQ